MPWSAGADVDLQRPPGGERDGGDEVLVGVDHPVAAEVLGDQPAAEAVAVAPAVLVVAGQLRRRHRREVAVGVELAVEVGQRGADVAAVVLEGHHVVVALRPQRRRAFAPDGDDVGELLQREVGEVLDVPIGVDDDEAPPARRARRGRRARRPVRGRAATSTGSGSRTPPARTGPAARDRPGTAGTAGRPRRWSSCSGARCGTARRGPRRR